MVKVNGGGVNRGTEGIQPTQVYDPIIWVSSRAGPSPGQFGSPPPAYNNEPPGELVSHTPGDLHF